MIIKQVKSRGSSGAAVSSLLDYLVSDGKQLGYQNEYPSGVGRNLMVAEAKAREGDKCYMHIISSVRFDENPSPEVWSFSEQQIKSVLSLENHPHFSATHYETDYHHLHMVLGSIDMTNGIRKEPWASYHKLGKARSIIENNHSLAISNPNNRGLYSRGFGGVKPKWDDEYIAQKKQIENKIVALSKSASSWADLQLQLANYHRLIMLLEKRREKEIAIYDKANRWLFDDFETDFVLDLEPSLGRFPFERVASVKSYLDDQDHGSLRPRAVKGIDMIDVDVGQAKILIASEYPDSRMAISKKGITNYGESLSVSLADYGTGRAGVYSNGVEPYSLNAQDEVCANLLAELLMEKGSGGIKQGYKLDNQLIEQFKDTHSRIKR